MEQILLTRDSFRDAVFQRDNHKCVICKAQGQDAHHIMERRLFSDGGYYLDNGATLCGPCHIKAEQTLISTEELREKAGIKNLILPEHLYSDQRYDKWANPILENGSRLRGELFDDISVRKVLEPVQHLFTDKVKYPRTPHLFWSNSLTKDDRILNNIAFDKWIGSEVIITEKRDGEQSSLYRNGIHARSLDFVSHPSRDKLKALHAKMSYEIPESWRICGENLTAKHSIYYEHLTTFFEVFGIWDGLECLSWDDTVTYSQILGLHTVPLLWRGIWNENVRDSCSQQKLFINDSLDLVEGYVIRPATKFHYKEFKNVVGKFVRENHINSSQHHWFNSQLVWNKYA